MSREAALAGGPIAGRIVVIDDEPEIRSMLAAVLLDEGHEVYVAENAESGLELLVEKMPDVCFLDVWLPDLDGLELLPRIRQKCPSCQVVVISGHASIEAAVKATQIGAVDFLEKPLGLEKVLVTAQNALRLRRLTEENERLRARNELRYQLIGVSEQLLLVKSQIERVARSNATVLVTGENGTGKENVSRALHESSLRCKGPFVAVNCAAIPEELIESELFGHEKGAFTGAQSSHRGKFELAHRGTIFLDEIGDMSLKTQSKLLRVLQDHKLERVGASKSIEVDVRVIAATNKDLQAEIAQGRFREDLFYRLNVIPIVLAPLRDRGNDVLLLAKHFLNEYCRENGEKLKTFDAAAEDVLLNHAWPGNVRELKNLMERLSILVPGAVIGAAELRSCGLGVGKQAQDLSSDWFVTSDFRQARALFEKEFIRRKLGSCGGNVAKTAELIGMERTHLYRKLKQLEIEFDDGSPEPS